MVTSEIAEVLIPKDFRFWFGGMREVEMEVNEIAEYWPGEVIGTIKRAVPFWGSRTFAVLRDDQGRWCISA